MPDAEPQPAPPERTFARYLDSLVVVDTQGRFVYLGRLVEVTAHELVLADVDVHDLQDAASSRDTYILDARRHGIRENRREVVIRLDDVLSVSRLDDVIKY